MQDKQTELKARIAELREKYARLERSCNLWVKISPLTSAEYDREIKQLQAQLALK
jgi:hypothetical protein